MNYVCGIDLGTTNTVCSILSLDQNQVSPSSIEVVKIQQYDKSYVKNELEELPSVVYVDIDEESVYTGHYAKELFETGKYPQQTVASFKMSLNLNSRYQIQSANNSTTISPQECSEVILKTVLQTLQRKYRSGPRTTVITVPAAFSPDERLKTRQAALNIGFDNVTLLDEPTAAMLYFLNGSGEGRINIDLNTPKYYLVYDIGGGTLDICVAKLYNNEYGEPQTEILGRSERADFGGDAFDLRLAAYLLEQFEKSQFPLQQFQTHQQLQVINRLLGHANRGKQEIGKTIIRKYLRWVDQPSEVRRRRLNSVLTESESIGGRLLDLFEYKGRSAPLSLNTIPVSGNQLLVMVAHLLGSNLRDIQHENNLISGFLRQAQETCTEHEILMDMIQPLSNENFQFPNNAKTPLLRTLDLARKHDPDLKISQILLTGGMSKFFAIDLLLRSHFEKDVQEQNINILPLDAMQAVCKGAAYHAYKIHNPSGGGIFGLKVTRDQLSSPICIKNGDRFDVIIPADTSPNTTGVFDYVLQKSVPTRIGIFLYTGNPAKPTELDNLDGRYFTLKKAYQKGDIIQIKWHLKEDKTIELKSAVGGLVVDASNHSTTSTISQIHNFNLNPGI